MVVQSRDKQFRRLGAHSVPNVSELRQNNQRHNLEGSQMPASTRKEEEAEEEGSKYEQIEWAEMLESRPPGVFYNALRLESGSNGRLFGVATPDLRLYCGSESCGGIRFFEEVGETQWLQFGAVTFFLNYRCRNCKKSPKTFAVQGIVSGTHQALVVKIGEHPSFGPPTPSRVISMIGPDRDAFLKGRRAESQGLGIGAFAYYRRVVENQKGRIIEQIAAVAARLGGKREILATFEKAAKETQFTTAIDAVKDSIPQSLMIDGHNPLMLLHGALSEGIHAQTDEGCLEIATSIRVVLTELADRISTALKDDAELKTAVSRLLNRNQTKQAPSERSE